MGNRTDRRANIIPTIFVSSISTSLINCLIRFSPLVFLSIAEVTADAILRGKLNDVDGEKFVEFTTATVDVTLKRYRIRVEKLFQDRKLSEYLRWMKVKGGGGNHRIFFELTINHRSPFLLFITPIALHFRRRSE